METTGRTVEEAKEAALDQLGVDETDAEFEIVEEPRFGLFGRLRSEARVRARVRPTKPRAKEERRDRRGRRKPGGDAAVAAAGTEGDDDHRPARAAVTAAAPANSAPAPARVDDRPDAEAGPARRNRRGRGGGGGGTGGAAGATTTPPGRGTEREHRAEIRPRQSSDDDDNMSPGGGMDVALEEQGAVAKEFLDGLIERMNLEAEVEIAQPEEDTIELNLEGSDLGLLIGPKGATLLSIQELTRTVVQRKTSAANGRILVDVGGYRRKRKDALARFSRQVAAEVVATGTRRALEPMSAADRKIVHDTLNDVDGVTTSSEGEEPRRRVVILPVAGALSEVQDRSPEGAEPEPDPAAGAEGAGAAGASSEGAGAAGASAAGAGAAGAEVPGDGTDD